MIKSKKETIFNFLFTLVMAILFLGAVNYIPFPSPGGIGLMIPSNIGIWVLVAVLITLSIYKITLSSSIKKSKLTLPMMLTLLAMVLPGFFQAEGDTREIFLRVFQVIGFFLLYISFTQFKLSARIISNVLFIVLLSSLVQILLALGQLYHNPETTPLFLLQYLGMNTPPVGTLLQVNIMAIFMVTSIVISFYLLFQPSFSNQGLHRKILLVIVILGGSYLISIISSRAAFIALALSVPLIIFARRKKIIHRKKWFITLALSCVFGLSSGLYFSNGESGLSKLENKTTEARMLAWKLSFQAIKENPILGYGLGGFTKAYFDQNENYTKNLDKKEYKSTSFFTHPHNEFLYWWIESGIISVIAIIALIIYFIRLLFITSRESALEYLALLTPITFHTQVSLTFYLSSLLMVLFIFFLAISTRNSIKSHQLNITSYFKIFTLSCSTLIFIAYIFFISETVSGIKTLKKITDTGSKNFHLLAKEINNPYWGNIALSHAHAISMSNEYKSGNIEKANTHLKWIEKKVLTHEDPAYYSLLLAGYKLFKDKEKYDTLISRLQNRYPNRFSNSYTSVIKEGSD